MGPRVGSGLPFLVKKRFPADGPSRRGSCYAEKQEKRLSPFSRARRPSCPAPFGTRPGFVTSEIRTGRRLDGPGTRWRRRSCARRWLRTIPRLHPGGGAAPSCARGRPFCSGGVGGCSASARRPSSRSRSRSFARWPFPIRKAALPWGRAAFIIFLRDACLAGRWSDAAPGWGVRFFFFFLWWGGGGGGAPPPPPGTGGRENPAGKAAEPRLSGEPADRAGRLRRDCPGGRGDWTPGRFGRATPPCSKTA